jgi:hypothetical protein
MPKASGLLDWQQTMCDLEPLTGNFFKLVKIALGPASN